MPFSIAAGGVWLQVRQLRAARAAAVAIGDRLDIVETLPARRDRLRILKFADSGGISCTVFTGIDIGCLPISPHVFIGR